MRSHAWFEGVSGCFIRAAYEPGISLAQTARRKKRFDTNQHRNTRLLEG